MKRLCSNRIDSSVQSTLNSIGLQHIIDQLNHFLLEKNSLYMLNPLTVHAVKNVGYSDYLEPLQLGDKDFISMPVNDSETLAKESGSPWSILVLNKHA